MYHDEGFARFKFVSIFVDVVNRCIIEEVGIQEFFGKDLEAATRIMLKIHLDGRAVCGVYSKDVAATRVDQVLEAALKAGHPLKCISEPVDF